jgi:DNA-binding transcriptional MocR family regulator
VLVFGSTSKVSWAGAGIALMGATEKNLAWFRGQRSKATIGPDKVNSSGMSDFSATWTAFARYMAKPRRDSDPEVRRGSSHLRARARRKGPRGLDEAAGG